MKQAMGRALRIEFPGAFYHVTARGNGAQPIFLADADRRRLITILQNAILKFRIRIHGYIFMTNHYHLLLETPLGNLSRSMHFINVAYTNYFNIRHKRIGHVLQGRYKGILIEKEQYLLVVSRYIHLNPVRAGMVSKPQLFPWSSYRDFLTHRDTWISRDDILNTFSRDRNVAIVLYKNFVEGDNSVNNPFEGIKAGTILGSEEFVEEALAGLDGKKISSEIPSYRQLLKVPTLDDIIEAVADYFGIDRETILQRTRNNIPKKVALYLGYTYSDCNLHELGQVLGGITYTACGKAIKRFEEERESDKKLDQEVSDLIKIMSNVKTRHRRLK
ncbi:MAG: transposase [PVC group bacterium]